MAISISDKENSYCAGVGDALVAARKPAKATRETGPRGDFMIKWWIADFEIK
jgi:hypothetical protein